MLFLMLQEMFSFSIYVLGLNAYRLIMNSQKASTHHSSIVLILWCILKHPNWAIENSGYIDLIS